MFIRVGLGCWPIAYWLCSLMARRFHYPLIFASFPSFSVSLLSPILDFLCSLHTFDLCRSQFVQPGLFLITEKVVVFAGKNLIHPTFHVSSLRSFTFNKIRGPGSSRLFIVSLRFCHPPSPRAGFRLLFIALGHSSEMSSVPREGLPTECDPWSPYLIIPDYWIDPIAYLPARTNG